MRLLVLHHSHTDIGYTETQRRVTRWHVDFLRQALRAIAPAGPQTDIASGGFKWNCETFWAVERFLDDATQVERDLFIRAARAERIGISGSYLNFSELIDRDLLCNVTRRAARFGEANGLTIDSAMTADVNGFGWGFGQVLLDNGIENLFACVHTHHGMYPLGENQVPFWWELPKGGSLLVWNGEHYHFGNELGLVPGAVSSYLTKDECDAEMIFGDPWAVAEIRIPRYLKRLEERGYPFDFVPVMASGLRSDNAPPNPGIVDFIERWNTERGNRCRIEMTTLGEFFRIVRAQGDPIPVHRGDWPDWWSDGPAGSPSTVRMFRQAQRDLGFYRRLCRRYPEIAARDLEAIETNLALFAEHTCSHAASVSDPWHPLVHRISGRKKGFAAEAAESIEAAIDEALEHLGGSALCVGLPLRYKLVNPHDRRLSGIVSLIVGDHEFHELRLGEAVSVFDLESGDSLPFDRVRTVQGNAFRVPVVLDAGQETVLEIRRGAPAMGDGKRNPAPPSIDRLETPFVWIEWARPEGIVRWTDRISGGDLLRADRRHAPFSPVYEVTPAPARDQISRVRGAMGLNRKGEDVQRSVGELLAIRAERGGAVIACVDLEYRCPGLGFYELTLEAYMNEPRVDAILRLHKESVWHPENLYISLPFAGAPSPSDLWLDKAGAAVRPRIDQIPGTCTDFYSVQGGVALTGDQFGLAIATPDTHLVQIGDLAHRSRPLAGSRELDRDPGHLYSWVMTNYWETNFEAELGGFYEFRFHVRWGRELAEPAAALGACRVMSRGIQAFRLGSGGTQRP